MTVDHEYEAFLKYQEKYEPDSDMVWSVEAETRDEAIAGYRDFMGWDSMRNTNSLLTAFEHLGRLFSLCI